MTARRARLTFVWTRSSGCCRRELQVRGGGAAQQSWLVWQLGQQMD